MGEKDYYKPGSWNVICDRCGFKAKGEELVREWNGLMVHPTCHEPRHPQDFVKSVRDNKPKPYYRPYPSDIFIDTTTPGGSFLVDEFGNFLTDEFGNRLTWEGP